MPQGNHRVGGGEAEEPPHRLLPDAAQLEAGEAFLGEAEPEVLGVVADLDPREPSASERAAGRCGRGTHAPAGPELGAGRRACEDSRTVSAATAGGGIGMSWYLAVLKKYATFSGRARRTEYWMFFLVNLIVSMVLGFVDTVAGTAFIGVVYSLAVLLPSLAVGVRRLHDIGRSGWWLLILLVPVIGVIVLLVFAVRDGDAGANAYGPSPKAERVQQTTLAT